MRIAKLDIKEKWDKEHNVTLSLKELQILHDAIWHIAYKDLNCNSDYESADVVYNVNDLDKLCDDIRDVLKQLDGFYDSEYSEY